MPQRNRPASTIRFLWLSLACLLLPIVASLLILCLQISAVLFASRLGAIVNCAGIRPWRLLHSAPAHQSMVGLTIMTTKQAVLIIHGIGEQRPMDTLRGFARTVWTSDDKIHHEFAKAGIFSKPDEISGSFELRRLTTTSDRNDVRTDFYEFYWAHLMKGTNLSHVITWLRSLLFRWPWNVPPALRAAWGLVAVLSLAAAFLAIETVLPEAYQPLRLPKWLAGSLGLLFAWCIVPVANRIVGDAARYLMPTPTNIDSRQTIRAKGVDVLNKLHQSREYERIVVVGHSLGSVIGYDILTHAWPDYLRHADWKQPNPALDAVEARIQQPEFALDQFQSEQRALASELRARGCGLGGHRLRHRRLPAHTCRVAAGPRRHGPEGQTGRARVADVPTGSGA